MEGGYEGWDGFEPLQILRRSRSVEQIEAQVLEIAYEAFDPTQLSACYDRGDSVVQK